MRTIFLAMLLMYGALTVSAQNNPPVPVYDELTVMSQVTTLLDVMANDYDPDGDSIRIIEAYCSSYYYNELEIVDNKLRYKAQIYTDYDYIWYVIADEHDARSEGYVDVYVIPNPDIPVAVADTFYLEQCNSYTLDVLANDYDPNGDSIKIAWCYSWYFYSSVSPDGMTINVNVPQFSSELVQYGNIEVGTAGEYQSGGTFVILKNIDSPVAEPDTVEVIGGSTIDIPVTANDHDPQDEEFLVSEIEVLSGGTAELIGDTIRFTAQYSYTGLCSIRYRLRELNDPYIYSDNGYVTVNVHKNPECPVAVNDTVYGIQHRSVIIDVLANDYDLQNDSVEFMDYYSYLNCDIMGDKLLYRPPFNTLRDSIHYRIRQVNNTDSYSEWASVQIFLEIDTNPPVAVTDRVGAIAGVPLKFKPLDNDLINGYDTLVLSRYQTSLNLSGSGGYYDSLNYRIYLPAYQADGRDSMIYKVYDAYGTECMSGEIYVNVVPHNFSDILDVNNIRANINANGHLFRKYLEVPGGPGLTRNYSPYYIFPASENTRHSTIFCSNLWLGGFDEENNLHLAGERYKEKGTDYIAGPVTDSYNLQHYNKYGRVWKLNKDEIEYHIHNYNSKGYVPPEAVASWPGNGNTQLGQLEKLAPFIDMNNDGIYNWKEGDYPLIRGDQAIYFMYNDEIRHAETYGASMRVEVHGMAYGYNDPSDTALYNTTFVHYDIINRSQVTYHDTRFATFADLDVGNPYNDVIGCDVTRGSYYAYNISDVDPRYDTLAPAQSVTILAGPYMDPDGIDNPVDGCNESVNGFNFGNLVQDDERLGMTGFSYFVGACYGPEGPKYWREPVYYTTYQNYMTDKWADGQHFVYGGRGHPSGGAVGPECRFLFPGDSDPLNWGTACAFPEGGYNQEGKFWTNEESGVATCDTRCLGIMGPFTFYPGDVQQVDIAYCTGLRTDSTSSLTELFRIIDSVRTKARAGKILDFNILLSKETTVLPAQISVYPNPARDFIAIKGLPESTFSYTIFNLTGLKVKEGQYLPSSDKLISIKDLPRSIYFLRLTTGAGQRTFKFVKS